MTKTTKLLLNTELSYVDHRSVELASSPQSAPSPVGEGGGRGWGAGWSLGSNIGVQQTLPWQLKFTTNL